MRANTRERNEYRRTIVFNRLEELKPLMEMYGHKSMFGWHPKEYHPVRIFVESIRTETGYAPRVSWKSIWVTIHRDYEKIQNGWKPLNQLSK